MSNSTSSAFKGIPNKHTLLTEVPATDETLLETPSTETPIIEVPIAEGSLLENPIIDETLLEEGTLEEQHSDLLKKEENVLERKIEVLQELKTLAS
jgi:hypothetical protein